MGVTLFHTPQIVTSAGRAARTLRHAALALALAALAAAALAGAFAPAAAAAPDAATIDAFLTEHGSPMAGNGAAFVAAGEQYGVDPAFLVAISGAETSFGQLLYSQNGDECTYNAFNWFFGPTWPQSDFASWSDGISRVAQGLAGPLYYGAGLYSVDAIAPTVLPRRHGELDRQRDRVHDGAGREPRRHAALRPVGLAAFGPAGAHRAQRLRVARRRPLRGRRAHRRRLHDHQHRRPAADPRRHPPRRARPRRRQRRHGLAPPGDHPRRPVARQSPRRSR